MTLIMTDIDRHAAKLAKVLQDVRTLVPEEGQINARQTSDGRAGRR